jgi:hypothetical protein
MKTIAKKTLGFVLLIIGVILLLTPLTPGAGVILFFALELLGLRLVLSEKIKNWHG